MRSDTTGEASRQMIPTSRHVKGPLCGARAALPLMVDWYAEDVAVKQSKAYDAPEVSVSRTK
jgi:hypothetical protein